MSTAMFREYIIHLPHGFSVELETALSEQQQREDREIETSEFFCYLLLRGLQYHRAVIKQDEAADKRIILP